MLLPCNPTELVTAGEDESDVELGTVRAVVQTAVRAGRQGGIGGAGADKEVLLPGGIALREAERRSDRYQNGRDAPQDIGLCVIQVVGFHGLHGSAKLRGNQRQQQE